MDGRRRRLVRRLAGFLAVTLAATAVSVVLAGRAGAVTHRQVITVSAGSPTSTSATLEAWQLQSNGVYKRVAGPWTARIGSQGMGATREGLSRTPVGQFAIGPTFGIKANPGTAMPWFTVDRNDVWGGDTAYPPSYNRHVRCAPYTCPFRISGHSERLINNPGSYDYAAFFQYNYHPIVVGKGSAFFLHVTNGRPTGGCVAVSRTQMVWLLRWMKPASDPMISLGIGANAYQPVPKRST
jgi:L,D-peptidoglycan transpeptidase YkuD (ErfK/YbiS/YcfS/YnhG family)